jgi:truncated hemoglobin YjbI
VADVKSEPDAGRWKLGSLDPLNLSPEQLAQLTDEQFAVVSAYTGAADTPQGRRNAAALHRRQMIAQLELLAATRMAAEAMRAAADHARENARWMGRSVIVAAAAALFSAVAAGASVAIALGWGGGP